MQVKVIETTGENGVRKIVVERANKPRKGGKTLAEFVDKGPHSIERVVEWMEAKGHAAIGRIVNR